MKKKLLYLASFLTGFTFVGHTMGQILAIPPEQTERLRIFEMMKSPVVAMPIGPAKSFADVLLGANLSVSVYLLVTAIFFFLFAKSSVENRSLVVINSLGVGAVAVLSALYFFPLPAACLALAAFAGIASTR